MRDDRDNPEEKGKGTLSGAFAPQESQNLQEVAERLHAEGAAGALAPQEHRNLQEVAERSNAPQESAAPPNPPEAPQPGKGDPNSQHPALTEPSPEARARHAQAMQRTTRGQLALSYYGGTFYSIWTQKERQPRQRERRGPER